MTTYKRVVSDWTVAAGVGVAAIFLGVMGVKSPLIAIAGFGLIAMVVAGAVNATLPTLAWLAIAPFVQAVEPGSPIILLTLAFHRFLLPVVAVASLTGQMVRRGLRFLLVEKLLLLFLVYAGVSLFIGWSGRLSTVEGSEAVRTFLLSYVVPFSALLIATRLPRPSHTKVFVSLALMGGAISGGGIVQALAGVEVFPGGALWQDIWDPRAVGPLANPAVSGYAAHVGMFAAVYLGIRRAAWRLPALATVLTGTAFTILTYTRSVWVALGVGAVAIAWLFPRARAWVVTGAVATVVAFAFNFGGFVDTAFLEERASNQENVDGRFAFGSTGFRMFKDEPIVGQGFGRYDVESRDFAAGFGSVGAVVARSDTSHNTFLTILAELGLAGLLLFAAAGFAGLRTVPRALRHGVPGVDRLKVAVLCGGLLSFIVSANLIDMRFFSFAWSLFWFLVGLLQTATSDDPDIARATPQKIA